MSLDLTPPEFQKLVEKLSKLIAHLYEEKDVRSVFPGKTPADVQQVFGESLPEEGMAPAQLLEQYAQAIFDHSSMNIGPGFYGYITGGGNQVAILAEMMKAALNQNNLKWHSSPVSTEMEKLVTSWVAEFVGYPSGCAGVLLDGGSVANFESLAIARKNKAPVDISEEGLYNAPPMTVYVSEQGHSSFDKAMDVLGIGKKYLRKIPVDNDFHVKVDAMEDQIKKDKAEGLYPICAIGIAGTTNSGAVDDLKALAELCKRHNLWFHVDGAYGGPAAKLEKVSGLFEGIDRADSLIVNPHKWLYVPFGAACVMVKNPEHMRSTFSTIPDYLKSGEGNEDRTDLMEYNLPLTKEFRSLKVWMTIKAFGAKRLRESIQADIDKAAYLVELVGESDKFELMAPAPLSIVCFRYVGEGLSTEELDSLNDDIIREVEGDGRVFLTGTKIKGSTAIRVCFINHRTEREHVRKLLKVLKEIGDRAIAS